MSTKNQPKVHQRGNPIANNPLMRKGGVHRKSCTSKRQKHKRETRRLVTKYMGTAARYNGGRQCFSRTGLSHSTRDGKNKGEEGKIPHPCIPSLFNTEVFNVCLN
jgi:hypothetical protein